MENNANKPISVILTGATGMVGEGVLYSCLQSELVTKVLVIGRRPSQVVHRKLREIIHKDFMDLSAIAGELAGYDSCFFCLGVSSVGMKEAEYTEKTYTLTMQIARVLSQVNPDLVFCYISGAGTDSSENGKIMWARVKGKTENDLMKLPLRRVYNFRPGVLEPIQGMKNTLGFYKWLGWLLPFIRLVAPSHICSLRQLGLAMISAASKGYEKQVLEVKDILILSGSSS